MYTHCILQKSIYWALLNIRLIHTSQLQAIEPCILIKYLDLKKCSLEETVGPLLRDLKILRTSEVFVEKLNTHLKGTLAVISADNLPSNELAGFSTSSSSKNATTCRRCLIMNKDVCEDCDYGSRTK